MAMLPSHIQFVTCLTHAKLGSTNAFVPLVLFTFTQQQICFYTAIYLTYLVVGRIHLSRNSFSKINYSRQIEVIVNLFFCMLLPLASLWKIKALTGSVLTLVDRAVGLNKHIFHIHC